MAGRAAVAADSQECCRTWHRRRTTGAYGRGMQGAFHRLASYSPQPYRGPAVLLRAREENSRLDRRWNTVCPRLRSGASSRQSFFHVAKTLCGRSSPFACAVSLGKRHLRARKHLSTKQCTPAGCSRLRKGMAGGCLGNRPSHLSVPPDRLELNARSAVLGFVTLHGDTT